MLMSRTLFSLFVLFVVSSAHCSKGLVAQPWEGGLDHALLGAEAYPLAPVHLSGGKVWEVVSGTKGRVVVEKTDGSRATVKSPRLSLLKGELFAEGMVEVLESSVNKTESVLHGGGLSNGFYSKRLLELKTAIFVRLLPSEDFDDVMLGVLFFDELGGHELILNDVGALKAGAERSLSFRIPGAFDTTRSRVNYAVLLFCPEGEIVTNGRRQMTPLLNSLFESFYSELVYAYRNKNLEANLPVSLVQQYPVFADASETNESPESPVYFTLSVDERGFVSGVKASEVLSDDVFAACERSFREWLFLPRLSGGYPRPSQVRVPVSFPAN